MPNTLQALKRLASLDYAVFFVTNQAGLAEGIITWDEFNEINSKVLDLIAGTGIEILKTYVCPHAEHDNCECRKPKQKLLLDAAREYGVDLANSWTVGDRPSDVMAGVNAGTKAILVKSGVPTVECRQATATLPSLLEAVEYIAAHES